MRLNKSTLKKSDNSLRRNKYIISYICIQLCIVCSYSQQYQFTQFYSSPTILAPSFAGLTQGNRLVLNYRDQWPKIPKTFLTYAVSYDQSIERMNSGVGIYVVRDQAGQGNLSLTDIGVLYSYDFKVDKDWHVRPGVNFRYSQRSIEALKLLFGDQINPDGTISSTSFETDNIRKENGYIDMASSVLVYSAKYWVGLNVDHLLMPDESLLGFKGVSSKIPIQVSTFGGVKIPLSSKNRRRLYDREVENVTFAFHYRNQGGFDQLDLGAYWNKSPFVLGLWFRGLPVISTEKSYSKIDAVILEVGYKISNLSFGYSYDITISSGLIANTGGSHEISLIYEFDTTLKKKRKHAIISCPKF
jgi:type IX secretion system PorP/SprF family membrane protein